MEAKPIHAPSWNYYVGKPTDATRTHPFLVSKPNCPSNAKGDLFK